MRSIHIGQLLYCFHRLYCSPHLETSSEMHLDIMFKLVPGKVHRKLACTPSSPHPQALCECPSPAFLPIASPDLGYPNVTSLLLALHLSLQLSIPQEAESQSPSWPGIVLSAPPFALCTSSARKPHSS